jgi:moderate conductance mechanosensitive channel
VHDAVQLLIDLSRWARSSGLEIVLMLSGSILLARMVRWLSARITGRIDERERRSGAVVSSEAAKHRHALTQVLTWTTVVLIYGVAAILILGRLGISLTTLAAPAAIAAAAVGFGGQRLVRDILAGFFVIAERQYGYGDIVRFEVDGTSGKSVTGTVQEVTLRATELRTPEGEVVITSNGQIIQVTNLTRDWARCVVDVPLPATVDVPTATEILQQVGADACADDDLATMLLDQPSVMGVEGIGIDELNMRLVARTLPGKQFDVGRYLRVRVTEAFKREGIASTPTVNTETTSVGS